MAENPQPPCRILAMASGEGHNFQALIDAVADGYIPNSIITRLIVNRSNSYSRIRAANAGIPWEYFNLITHGFMARNETNEQKIVEGRERYDTALAEKVLSGPEAERPELVALVGWMYILGPAFLGPMTDAGIRVINIHPALPGEYDGAGAIERAYHDFQEGKACRTGVTVHYAIPKVDAGHPIMTEEILFRKGESLRDFDERVHKHEARLLELATAKVVEEIVARRKGQ